MHHFNRTELCRPDGLQDTNGVVVFSVLPTPGADEKPAAIGIRMIAWYFPFHTMVAMQTGPD